MLLENYDPRIDEFLKQYPEGKIPSMDIQEWFLKNKGLPKRTFQYHMVEEIIPAPKYVEGRNHYYLKDEFTLLVDLIDIIRELKVNPYIRYKSLRIIFKKHDLRKVADKLLDLIENWPLYEADHTEPNPLYREHNYYRADRDYIWRRTIEELEKGKKNLDEIKFNYYEEEYTKREEERLKK